MFPPCRLLPRHRRSEGNVCSSKGWRKSFRWSFPTTRRAMWRRKTSTSGSIFGTVAGSVISSSTRLWRMLQRSVKNACLTLYSGCEGEMVCCCSPKRCCWEWWWWYWVLYESHIVLTRVSINGRARDYIMLPSDDVVDVERWLSAEEALVRRVYDQMNEFLVRGRLVLKGWFVKRNPATFEVLCREEIYLSSLRVDFIHDLHHWYTSCLRYYW